MTNIQNPQSLANPVGRVRPGKPPSALHQGGLPGRTRPTGFFSSFSLQPLAFSLLLRGFLRPGVLERDGAIEHENAGLAVFVEGEIPEALELVAEFRFRLAQAG